LGRRPGVPRRYQAVSRTAGPARRCGRTGCARLRAARQSLAYRHRRPGARVRCRHALALRPVPLRLRRRWRCAGRARLPRCDARRGVCARRAGSGGGGGGVSAQPHAAAAPLDRLDRPLRDLRLSVLDACTFRCGYCMPADRVPDDYGLDAAGRLSFDEIEALVRGAVRLGVSKLRITGGEPLLRKGLPQLVARLARIEGIDDLAMTTNGSLLARHAQALRDAGLRRITVSLDALDPARFRALSGGRGDVDDVLAGIAAAEAAGFDRLKIN